MPGSLWCPEQSHIVGITVWPLEGSKGDPSTTLRLAPSVRSQGSQSRMETCPRAYDCTHHATLLYHSR